MRKEKEFNNLYFLGPENLKEVKRADPNYAKIFFGTKSIKKIWKPEKLGHSKILSFILDGVDITN